MKHVHWIGTGLSSIPGIRRLAKNLDNLTVWNRTLDKALKSIDHVDKNNVNAKQFDIDLLFNETNPGDIVISQLPANKHLKIAELCLKNKCHFASTSYLNSEINALNTDVKKENLVFINEVGLDPGIDHFFSHLLVSDLKKISTEKIEVIYESYCGGFPAIPNDFKYKFSWSPVGVIKALSNKAKFIDNFNEKIVTPYHHINSYNINNENFEAYPNRDSIPYIKEYLFPQAWKIKDFIRGTLRLNGWADAWKDIFAMLENPSKDLDNDILIKSDELWSKYQYEKNEKDRVVLSVSLDAINDKNVIIWSGCYELDETGEGENTAMAILVSVTLSGGIDLILKNKLKPGVQAAPHNRNNIEYFFNILKNYNIHIKKK